MLWFSFTGGAGWGVQMGSREISADQPITKAKTKKWADAFSGAGVEAGGVDHHQRQGKRSADLPVGHEAQVQADEEREDHGNPRMGSYGPPIR